MPNINLVTASVAGIEPKIIMVKGKNIHWANIITQCQRAAVFGLGGKRVRLIQADAIKPIMETVIKSESMWGVFWTMVEFKPRLPAIAEGRRPRTKIKIGAVAQE